MAVNSDPRSQPIRSVHRLRLTVIGIGITLLVFSQSPGYEAADTKLDLVVAPLRFLGNALHMWDPLAAAGQMQDQAYGYLFPMGPFFLAGHAAAIPPWVVQRGWEALLLIVAFLGTVRLARLLRVPGTWPRVVAGLAYALAPRMLMELGVISSELLPVVALPWVLIPLVRGAESGSPRRAAARSGAALLIAGGINASATLAVLPVPALWLLTRTSGPRRRALASWWVLAVVLASVWWVVPLIVLGRFSPPFLDWIESSTVTTGRTDLIEVLRGADHWQAYLGPSIWPAGWTFVASSAVVLATSAVAAFGLAALSSARTPHRLFLVITLAVGVVAITAGHVGSVSPAFAVSVRHLLDGPLNAFRNVHKFDPLVRLPLAIGVGHATAALATRIRRRTLVALGHGASVPSPVLAVGAVLVAGTVAIAPALTGRLIPDTRTLNDPTWWAQTGAWLSQHTDGRALVVPGAPAPVYFWGSPRDDALQPLANAPWTVRDVAPLVQPGYVRLLDAVGASLETGRSDLSLPTLLARAGVRYLVVRNDLDTQRSGASPLRFVHAAVAATPQFAPIAQFGPDLTTADNRNRFVDLGLSRPRGAVDVYVNTAWTSQVALLPASGAVATNGSADTLPALFGAGLPATTPVVFGPAAAALSRNGVEPTEVLTDGLRRREFGFGGVDRYSATLTPDAQFGATRAAHDYIPADSGSMSTVAYTGISAVKASSTASDPTAPFYQGPTNAAWAALDASPVTSWRSASVTGAVNQWLQVQFPLPVRAAAINLAFAPGPGTYPSRLRVSTESGTMDTDVAPDTSLQSVRLPRGPMRSLRLTVLRMADGGRGSQVGISRLLVPGVQPSRVVNVVGPTDPAVMAFRVVAGSRSACLAAPGGAACDPGWAKPEEEDLDLTRGFSLSVSTRYDVAARLALRPGAALDALLDRGNPITARASSRDSSDPRERPGAVLDQDVATGWVAAQGDRTPTLTLQFDRVHALGGIVLTPLPATAPVTRARVVLIRAGAVRLRSSVPSDGYIAFPAFTRAATVRITVEKAGLAASTDSLTGQAHLLPVGLGQVSFVGPDAPVARTAAQIELGCGAGIVLGVDGAAVALQVSATASAVLAGDEVPATACNGTQVSFRPGRHEVAIGLTERTVPRSLTLTRAGSSPFAAVASPGQAQVVAWSDTGRRVRVSTSAVAVLVVRENANAAWQATLHGRRLSPVLLDGWQQAWVLPAGARGLVRLEFTPQPVVDAGLLAGLLAILILAVLSAAAPRRSAASAPSSERRPGSRTATVLVVVALAAAGGFIGAIVGLGVAVAIGHRPSPGSARRDPSLAGPVAAALVVVGVLAAFRPAGSGDPLAGSAVAQILCLLALALVVGGLVATAPLDTAPAA